MYDLRGLSGIVQSAVANGELREVNLTFEEHYLVADAMKLGDKTLKVRDEPGVPWYSIAVSQNEGWVIVGKGGTFYNDAGRPDNYWLEPTQYTGLARVLEQPVAINAPLPNGETVPFAIAGVIGLEGLVKKAGSNGHGKGVLSGTANYRLA